MHAVTDSLIARDPKTVDTARRLPLTNRLAIHARGAELSGRALCMLANAFRQARPEAPVFVNDRVDVAIVTGAHGVHLPETGLPIVEARYLVPPDVWVGRSVHHPRDADAAFNEGADYVFLGPIWETGSHTGMPALGVHAIKAVSGGPVIAIGGVTPARVPTCLSAGAYGVAAVSAFWHAADPGSVAEAMLLSFET